MRLHKITLLLGTIVTLRKILGVDDHFIAILTNRNEEMLVNRYTTLYDGALTPNTKHNLLQEFVGKRIEVTLTPAGLAALTDDMPHEYGDIASYRMSREAIIRKVSGNNVTIALGYFKPDSEEYYGLVRHKVPIRYIESIRSIDPEEVVRDESDGEEGAEVPADAVDASVELE
jgi:hypothetical protein